MTKFYFTECQSFVEYSHKYIEDIPIFGMNMPFISSSEAKNAYFMSGEATNEIYIFSLHEKNDIFTSVKYSFF